MEDGARTPEELETLLEDACLLGDDGSLDELYAPGAVLAVGSRLLRGVAIRETLPALGYVADPQRVLQSSGTALIVTTRAISVAQRSPDRVWRYAISLMTNPKGHIR